MSLDHAAGVIQSHSMDINDHNSISLKKQLYLDFVRLVRNYMEAKQFQQNGHLLDSFNRIIHSLHQWARIAILEGGEQPKKTVWEQIRTIDPSVYKLYEELVTSDEPLKKRIDLLLLALDFTVQEKMESCVQIILDIIKTREEPWTVEELLAHPEISDPYVDLFFLLEKMVKRSLLHEHVVEKNGDHQKVFSII